jgi:esterase/lipase superfamily enzyme
MNPATCLIAALLLLPAAHADDHSASPASPSFEKARVGIFYATNRERLGGGSAESRYGGRRGEPAYGRCEVQFNPIPIVNRMAPKVPFHLPSETRDLEIAGGWDLDGFLDRVTAAAAATTSGSAVLFVHGYNYDFARTCRMAAELQRDLADAGTVVMFSWPANGLPTDYVQDQADVEWSVPFLADLIDRLGEALGPEKVQLLAHSLGTRGVVMALQRLRSDRGEGMVAGRLVLLAPDFDSQTFVELLPRLRPMTGGITLYASANDAPLKVSRQVSGYPRLGEGGGLLTIAEGVQSIDVSGAGRYQILGHEYFYYHPLVAADLVELLGTGRPAGERAGLAPRIRNGAAYWEIGPPAAPRDGD